MAYRTFHSFPSQANTLRLHRHQAGLTQEQIALALGFSTTAHISEWETGRRQPTLLAAMRLAQLLGTYVEYLFPLHWAAAKQSVNDIPPRRITTTL